MLTNHIRLASEQTLDTPQDILASSLGVIFPDDITNQHGSAGSSIIYLSPRFGEIELSLADPKGEECRSLFGHFLWNSGVQLGLLIDGSEEEEAEAEKTRREEIGGNQSGETKHKEGGNGKTAAGVSENEAGYEGNRDDDERLGEGISWSVKDKTVLELGAGSGLVGILAAMNGASRVVISDYPAPEILANITANIARHIPPRLTTENRAEVRSQGHTWGDFADSFSIANKACFERILVSDCLWMPWQHGNLLDSINWFLNREGKAWVVAGFHTGRKKMRGFFEEAGLKGRSLRLERIWERDAEGHERRWEHDRGRENVTERKRWLVIAILGRMSELE